MWGHHTVLSPALFQCLFPSPASCCTRPQDGLASLSHCPLNQGEQWCFPGWMTECCIEGATAEGLWPGRLGTREGEEQCDGDSSAVIVRCRRKSSFYWVYNLFFFPTKFPSSCFLLNLFLSWASKTFVIRNRLWLSMVASSCKFEAILCLSSATLSLSSCTPTSVEAHVIIPVGWGRRLWGIWTQPGLQSIRTSWITEWDSISKNNNDKQYLNQTKTNRQW